MWPFVAKVNIVEDGTDLSHRSVGQLRTQADAYRQMARTSRMIYAAAALLKIADRFNALADEREQEPSCTAPAQRDRAPN
jgi:hypothetical protein